MPQWFEAGRVGDLANHEWTVLAVNGTDVAIFNLDGEYFAIEDVCSHYGSPLSTGWLEGDHIVCPRHLAEFCVRTGEVRNAPAHEPVHSFPVRVRCGIIEVCDDRQGASD